MTERGFSMGNGLPSMPLESHCLDLHSIVCADGLTDDPSVRLSPEAIADIQQLLTILDQLHAPDSGWPDELPKTPEAIAPYVAEEVDRVLDQDWSPVSDPVLSRGQSCGQSIGKGAIASPVEPSHLTLEAWLSHLMWQVVCSDWTMMQWLEGVAAWQLRSEDHAEDESEDRSKDHSEDELEGQSEDQEESGLVRLMPCIEFSFDDHQTRLDLTTYRSPAACLPAETVLRTVRLSKAEETTVAALLDRITDGLSMVPVLRSLLAGQSIRLLQPGQQWQTVTVSMGVGLEFRPYPVEAIMGGDRTGWPNLQVQFTPTDWRLQVQSMLVQTQQRRAIEAKAFQWRTIAQQDDAVFELVRQADELVAQFKHPLWQTHCTVVENAIALQDLNHWLIWNLSRCDDRVMQLLGGVAMRSLQPGQGWQSGRLRLVAALQIETPNRTLAIDLATGQRLTADAIDQRAIVQSLGTDWTAPAIPASDLLASVQQNIGDRSPVVQPFQEPVDIELRDARGDRLGTGTLQLRLFLEWVA